MADDPDLDSAYALSSPDDVRKLYATWAATYDADFLAATGYLFPKLVAETYVAKGGGWPCLDVGCGTGAIADHMPSDAVLDGLDLSPEMLGVAAKKGRYRDLIEADLTRDLALPGKSYNGCVSSGTFTHGHVDGTAIARLVPLLAQDALAVLSIKPEIFETHAFDTVFDALQGDGLITAQELSEHPLYLPGQAPAGHADDVCLLAVFRTL